VITSDADPENIHAIARCTAARVAVDRNIAPWAEAWAEVEVVVEAYEARPLLNT
jgi:hypothetical protein